MQKTIRYRSNFERLIAQYLHRHNVEYAYEDKKITFYAKKRQAKCGDCGSENVLVKREYLPDFHLLKNDVYIEAKGRFLNQDRTKLIAVKKSNPEMDIRILFMYDNWVSKAKKKRYTDWCDFYGFPWHISRIGNVPKEWML